MMWEETRISIRKLVEDMEQLSYADIEPPQFYLGFLERLIAALAAIGGAVWLPNSEGELKIAHEFNLDKTGLGRTEDDLREHARLMERLLDEETGALVRPGFAANEAFPFANPTEYLLVCHPVEFGSRLQGVVEVFQRPVS